MWNKILNLTIMLEHADSCSYNQVVFQTVFYLDLPSAIFLKTLMTSDSSRPNSSGSVALNLFMHCTWGQSIKNNITV